MLEQTPSDLLGLGKLRNIGKSQQQKIREDILLRPRFLACLLAGALANHSVAFGFQLK
jgi:hypothetical protein